MADKKAKREVEKQEEEVQPADDVAQAQPSIEEDAAPSTSGSIQGGLNNAPGEIGGERY